MKKTVILAVSLAFLILFVYKAYEAQLNNEYVSLSFYELPKIGYLNPKDAFISPISIDYLRSLDFEASDITLEEELQKGANYKKYIASYISDSNKVYGLLTIPDEEPPEGGFSAIVFNHGYISPDAYVTTEKYEAYVDSLARKGFVVFKIDFRGHGNSEGVPSGSYFSNAYTVDAINALKSLQRLATVNPEKIGMWGHSMSGNLVLRAMLVSDDVKAGVIWGGAVYSYEDFAKYRISDNSYVPRPRNEDAEEQDADRVRERSDQVQLLRSEPEKIDFNDTFWSAVSLTKNIQYLTRPIQLHHAVNDDVVDVGYSRDLKKVLDDANKRAELYEYEGGGHNINSPYFELAMQRTVNFFKEYLQN